jgi:uncharacterized protein (TIGR02001 family)
MGFSLRGANWIMKRLLTRATVLALATYGASALCEEAAAPEETGPLASGNFSSTIYFTNEYMFRGISNSDGPAIQGSVDWTYSGFFLGAWGSNTEFSDGNFEIDYYGGYRWSLGGVGMTLQGIYYTYPSEDNSSTEGLDPGFVDINGNPAGPDADYVEVNVGASYTFPGQLAPTLGANYFFSPDTFGEDGNSHTVQGTFGLTLPGDVGFYANVGWNDTEGDKSSGGQLGLIGSNGVAVDGFEYVYFSVGVNKVLKGFKFDVGYHGTDESDSLKAFYGPAAPPFGNFRELIEGEFVFTVSRSF